MSDNHWSRLVPASVTDALTPGGDECRTPTDRRMLWHLESTLAVNAPIGSHLDKKRRVLRQYLNETCQHEWTRWPGDNVIDAHRQCLWCSTVEWEADA